MKNKLSEAEKELRCHGRLIRKCLASPFSSNLEIAIVLSNGSDGWRKVKPGERGCIIQASRSMNLIVIRWESGGESEHRYHLPLMPEIEPLSVLERLSQV